MADTSRSAVSHRELYVRRRQSPQQHICICQSAQLTGSVFPRRSPQNFSITVSWSRLRTHLSKDCTECLVKYQHLPIPSFLLNIFPSVYVLDVLLGAINCCDCRCKLLQFRQLKSQCRMACSRILTLLGWYVLTLNTVR